MSRTGVPSIASNPFTLNTLPSTPISRTNLFTAPVRRDLLVGTGLALVATFRAQGAIQWTLTWITAMLRSQGITEVTTRVSLVSMTLTTGNIVGSLSFPLLADRWGRKTALLIYFSECLHLCTLDFLPRPGFHHSPDNPFCHGIFRRPDLRRFCRLFSRALLHLHTRNGPRILLQLCPSLFSTGPVHDGAPCLHVRFFCACHHRRWTGLHPGSFHHCFFRARDQGATSSRLVFITALLHSKYNAIYDALFHT